MTRRQLFIVLVLVGLSSGSSLYVGHSLLKPSQLLPLLALACLPQQVVFNKLRYDRTLLWIGLYVLLAGAYNIPPLVKEQLIDWLYILGVFWVYMAAVMSAQMISEGQRFPAKVTLLVGCGLLALYFGEVLTNSYIVPKTESQGFYSSVFNNANDLASFIVVFMPLAIYSVRLWTPHKLVSAAVFCLLSGWVLVLGSRFCILSLPVVLLMFALLGASSLWKFVLACLSGLTGVLLSQFNWAALLKTLSDVESAVVSRSASRLSLLLFDFGNDRSSSYRMDSYLYAISHLDEALFGVGTKNYQAFYENGFGADTLVAFVPHSYLIENTLAFGWFGLFLVISILLTCFVDLLKHDTCRAYGLTSLVLFLMISFVPSTMIRLPIFWFPVFFFAQLAKLLQSQHLSKHSFLQTDPNTLNIHRTTYQEAY